MSEDIGNELNEEQLKDAVGGVDLSLGSIAANAFALHAQPGGERAEAPAVVIKGPEEPSSGNGR